MTAAIKPWATSLLALALVLGVIPASATPTSSVCADGTAGCALPTATETEEETVAEPLLARSSTPARDRSPHFFASKSYNRWYAQLYIARVYDWGQYHWRCLDELWQIESGWNELAKNKRSGAYGIAQALPAKKMEVFGRNWQRNPEVQIKWGTSYIKSRYKSPCKALKARDRKGWY